MNKVVTLFTGAVEELVSPSHNDMPSEPGFYFSPVWRCLIKMNGMSRTFRAFADVLGKTERSGNKARQLLSAIKIDDRQRPHFGALEYSNGIFQEYYTCIKKTW